MNCIVLTEDYLFLTLRLDKELNHLCIHFKSNHYPHQSLYMFDNKRDKNTAELLIENLKEEFRFDIQLIDLEKKIQNINLYNNLYQVEKEKMKRFYIYQEIKKDSKLINMINRSNIYSLDFEDLSYEEFERGYGKLLKKDYISVFNILDNVIHSNEYKIEKINILNKIIK
jgi:hypothetical protein